jgi:TRAP-type C4-dicarboxylate transport system permease small subunit
MGAATLQRLRDCYIATIDWLSRATGMIAALLLAISILVISEMIFVRYILNESTYWQTEFVVYSITATTLVGSPYVLLTNGHVAVTLFPDAIGGRGGRLIQFFGQIAGFCFSALLAYSGWYYFLETYINGWTSDTIWAIHMWIPVSAMPLGLTLLTLQYLAEMVRPRHEE